MNAHPYDVAVIGGGPAGLQAALTLGRLHRAVLLLDSGEYRNAAAKEMHNFVTHDGRSPEEFRTAARRDLQAYDTVEVRELRAAEVADDGGLWRVTLDDAGSVETPDATGRRVVLATGLRDTLPDIPGLSDLWGDVVAHCPYCHGHELSGRHVGILGSGPHVARVALLLERIAARITVYADGAELDEAASVQLAEAGVGVRTEKVSGVRRSSTGATVGLSNGADEEVAGLFVSTALAQAAPFAEQLSLELLPSGCIRIDELGRTSRQGIYAAGDLAHLAALPMPLASVLNASSAGLLAATAAEKDLLAEDHGQPVVR
ncbi:MAG: NAD(P)/FAD-dependent oxidoreductase [Nocardioidaceae bacterium]